jgi:hypothetical protein
MVTAAGQLFPGRTDVTDYIHCAVARHGLDQCDRTVPVYAGERKVLLVQLRYATVQLALQLTGRATIQACTTGAPFTLYFRPDVPVSLVNPALTGPASTDPTPPSTSSQTVSAVCPGRDALSLSVTTPGVIYALADLGSPTPTDLLLIDAPSAGMAVRPARGAVGTCVLGGGGTAMFIRSVTPSTGSTVGGQVVTIDGANFAAGATVTFGGVAAAVTAAGAVDVVVAVPGGQTVTAAGGFTYLAPLTGDLGGGKKGCGCAGGGASVELLALLPLLGLRRRRGAPEPRA